MSLPITELTIDRFRGLRDVVLQQFGLVNIFVGPNNSGKTSVLESISLAANPLDPRNWVQTATRRDPFGFALRSGFFSLRWLFPQSVTTDPHGIFQGQLKLSVKGGALFRDIRADYIDLRSLPEVSPSPDENASSSAPLVTERSGVRLEINVVPQSPATPPIRETFDWWEDERNLLSLKSIASIPLHVVTAYDHLVMPLLAEQYSEARRRGNTDQLIELLSRIDGRISGLEILAPPSNERRRTGPLLYIRDSSAGLLPLESFGDGIRRILLMAFAITSARNGILLVDEIETAIHISALGRAFRWMVQACKINKVQLFVTTHSLEAIDAMLAADDTQSDDDIVGYRFDVNAQTMKVQRYGEDLLRRLRMERGLEVR